MAKKAQWAKSTNGPDWTDVETHMRALEALHSAHVAIIVSPAGTGFSGGVQVVASAIFERLPGSQLPASVTAMKGWPCATHARLSELAFSLLYTLDFEISKVYKNEKLWK